MEVPAIQSVYTEADFDQLGFHDCHVHGIRWDSDNYSFIFDLDYIVKWVERDGVYNFWVSPAELCFEYASKIKLSFDWSRYPMQAAIDNIHKREQRYCPDGKTLEYRWQMEFAMPEGSIELWSSHFQPKILEPPVLCETQYLR